MKRKPVNLLKGDILSVIVPVGTLIDQNAYKVVRVTVTRGGIELPLDDPLLGGVVPVINDGEA